MRSDSYVHFGDGPEYYAETGIFEGLVTVAVYWAKLHCAVWFVYVAMCYPIEYIFHMPMAQYSLLC